jgi:hypothetical protein
MMSLLTCIPKEIWAALIQALPVICAAYVGYRSLNTWQKQLREDRHVEHVEKALAAASEMFPAIRAARSPRSQISEEDYADDKRRILASQRIRVDRLTRAWDAWRRFQDHYGLARLFTDPAKPQLDVGSEVADCIYALQGHLDLVFYWYDQWFDFKEDTAAHREAMRELAAFYGKPFPDRSFAGQPASLDSIEERLRIAENALQAELRPILLLKPWFAKSSKHGPAGNM